MTEQEVMAAEWNTLFALFEVDRGGQLTFLMGAQTPEPCYGAYPSIFFRHGHLRVLENPHDHIIGHGGVRISRAEVLATQAEVEVAVTKREVALAQGRRLPPRRVELI